MMITQLLEIMLVFIDANDLLEDENQNTVQKFIDNLPLFIGMKNFTSQYLIGNSFYAKMVGLSNSQALKGIYDDEVKCQAKQLSHLFVAEDAVVMKQNHAISVLTCCFYANNKSLLLYGKKYPIIDKKNGYIGMWILWPRRNEQPIY